MLGLSLKTHDSHDQNEHTSATPNTNTKKHTRIIPTKQTETQNDSQTQAHITQYPTLFLAQIMGAHTPKNTLRKQTKNTPTTL